MLLLAEELRWTDREGGPGGEDADGDGGIAETQAGIDDERPAGVGTVTGVVMSGWWKVMPWPVADCTVSGAMVVTL